MQVHNTPLPEDILETIVDCVSTEDDGDDETLRSLALVSRSLLIPVQKHLFRRIIINPKPQKAEDYNANVTPAAVTRLKDVLSINPRLIAYIQVLQLIQRQEMIHWDPPTAPPGAHPVNALPPLIPQWASTNWLVDRGEDLAEVLDMIIPESTSSPIGQARIRQLTISSTIQGTTDRKTWDNFHPDLQKVLRRIYNLPTLEVVVINHLRGIPRDLFLQNHSTSENGGSLKRLELMNTAFALEPAVPTLLTPRTISKPSRIKYLYLVPRIDNLTFNFALDMDLLSPRMGLSLDDLEEFYLDIPTSVPIPSLLDSLFMREGGFQRLKKVHIDFKFYMHSLSQLPVWQFSSFTSLANFPLLEQVTFEGPSTINIINQTLEFEWMREAVPFIEAYTSLYTTAAASATSSSSNPDQNRDPPLTSLTLAVLMLSNPSSQPYGDFLTTVSDRLHKLHLAASSFAGAKAASNLRLRIELKGPLEGNPVMRGGTVPIRPDQERTMLKEWKEIFSWADEDVDVELGTLSKKEK